MEVTSLTQVASQREPQQYGSWAHSVVTQGSQETTSAAPVAQMPWLHVVGPASTGGGAVHDWWQIDKTSPTHVVSHALEQQ